MKTSLFFVTVKGAIFKGGSVPLHTHPPPRINPSHSRASKETAVLRTEMSHPLLRLDFKIILTLVCLCARLTRDKKNKCITIALREDINTNVL